MVTLTTPLPAAPQRGDGRDDFSDDADGFAEALVTFQIQQNQQASDVEALAAAAQAAATTATQTPATAGSSTTSLAIGLGSRTLTIQTGKNIANGTWVAIVRTSDGTKWMSGPATYNSGTGQLVVNVQRNAGTGTFSDWTVYVSNPMISDTTPRALAAGSTVDDPTGAPRPIGYRGMPVISVTTSHVLALADVGCILELGAGGSITVPLKATVTFTAGDTILVRDVAGSSKAITPASGVTLRWGPSSVGARSLAAYGLAPIQFSSVADLVFIGGDVT